MSNGAFTIARKELAKFFSNRVSALVSIVLPGLLIFVVWTVMGDAMGSMFQPDVAKRPVVAVVNEPASLEALADAAGIDVVKEGSLPDADRMREAIEQGDVKAFALFPEGFDESVAAYDPLRARRRLAWNCTAIPRIPIRCRRFPRSRPRSTPTSRRCRTGST